MAMNKDLKLLVTGFVTLLISIVLFVATIVIFAVQLGKNIMDVDWNKVYDSVSDGIEEITDDVPELDLPDSVIETIEEI